MPSGLPGALVLFGAELLLGIPLLLLVSMPSNRRWIRQLWRDLSAARKRRDEGPGR